MYISEASKPPGVNVVNEYGYQTIRLTRLTGTFDMPYVDNYGAMCQYVDVYLPDGYLTDVSVQFSDDYYEGAVSLFMTGNKNDVTVSLDNFANTSGLKMYLDISDSNITDLSFGDYDFNTDYAAEIDISGNKLSAFPAGFWTGVEAMATVPPEIGSVNASGEQMPEPDQYEWDSIGFAQYNGWTISVNGSNATITVSGATGDGAAANGTYHWDGMYWNHDSSNGWMIGYTGGQWSLTDFNVSYYSNALIASGWDDGVPADGNPTTALS